VPRDISTTKRVAKLIRLFSTTNDGECLAAARALQRVLVELGTDLRHLADLVEANWTAPVVDLFDKRETKLQPWQIRAAEFLRREHDRRIIWGSRERDFLHNEMAAVVADVGSLVRCKPFPSLHGGARPDFKNSGKVSRVANRPDGFRTGAEKRSNVLSSPERICQWLALLLREFAAEALRVKGAVAVIAVVRIPASIGTRDHDVNIALLRTPDPQREPQIGAFANGHRISTLARRHRPELHPPDLGV
jgi:hypothetical protein